MIRKAYPIPLKPGQLLYFIPIGDIHFDSLECDQDRLVSLVKWVRAKEKRGATVRLVGHGDYLDFASPSERRHLGTETLHETTSRSLDLFHLQNAKGLLAVLAPIKHTFLGLLSGHHNYRFVTKAAAGEFAGRTSDEWLAVQLGCDYLGTGASLYRLQFPHLLYLDVLSLHGAGGAQTPGGRVMKRIRFAEIAPTAHLVISGHDNAKLAYPRSGLDFDHGKIKRYVIGSGSFQRAYLDGDTEAGYAEQRGLVPADLGVTIVTIQVEKRQGEWRVDYHCSV